MRDIPLLSPFMWDTPLLSPFMWDTPLLSPFMRDISLLAPFMGESQRGGASLNTNQPTHHHLADRAHQKIVTATTPTAMPSA